MALDYKQLLRIKSAAQENIKAQKRHKRLGANARDREEGGVADEHDHKAARIERTLIEIRDVLRRSWYITATDQEIGYFLVDPHKYPMRGEGDE